MVHPLVEHCEPCSLSSCVDRRDLRSMQCAIPRGAPTLQSTHTHTHENIGQQNREFGFPTLISRSVFFHFVLFARCGGARGGFARGALHETRGAKTTSARRQPVGWGVAILRRNPCSTAPYRTDCREFMPDVALVGFAKRIMKPGAPRPPIATPGTDNLITQTLCKLEGTNATHNLPYRLHKSATPSPKATYTPNFKNIFRHRGLTWRDQIQSFRDQIAMEGTDATGT